MVPAVAFRGDGGLISNFLSFGVAWKREEEDAVWRWWKKVKMKMGALEPAGFVKRKGKRFCFLFFFQRFIVTIVSKSGSESGF